MNHEEKKKECLNCAISNQVGSKECAVCHPSNKEEGWKAELVTILPLEHATLEVHNILFKFVAQLLKKEYERGLNEFSGMDSFLSIMEKLRKDERELTTRATLLSVIEVVEKERERMLGSENLQQYLSWDGKIAREIFDKIKSALTDKLSSLQEKKSNE